MKLVDHSLYVSVKEDNPAVFRLSPPETSLSFLHASLHALRVHPVPQIPETLKNEMRVDNI